MKERKISYDILKIIAVFSAMLVHYDIPENVINVLAYSVPMLIFLSGILASNTKRLSYTKYVWSRINRIIIPSYIFIIVILMCRLIVASVFDAAFYTPQRIIDTLLLCDNGIGYVWISRVFLVLALVGMFVTKLNAVIKHDGVFLALSISCMFITNMLTFVLQGYADTIWFQYSVYCIPYVLIYAFGARTGQSRNFKFYGMLSMAVIFLVGIAIVGFCPGAYKYPPQLLYISYGILLSYVLMIVVGFTDKVDWLPWIRGSCKWLSVESFNLYLIHAFLIIVFGWIKDRLPVKIPEVIIIVSVTLGAIIIDLLFQYGKRRILSNGEKKCSRKRFL